MKKTRLPALSIFIYILAVLYGGFILWTAWVFYQNALSGPLSLTPSLITVYALGTLSCLCIFIILIALGRLLRLPPARPKVPARPEVPMKHKTSIQPKALKPITNTSITPAQSKTPHSTPHGNSDKASDFTRTSPSQPSGHEHCSMVSVNMFVPNCEKALSFYEQAFGAISVHVHFSAPEGEKSARFKIGSDLFALADENPERNTKSALTLGGAPVCLQLFVEDVRKTVERALVAGADVMPPSTLARPVVTLSDNTELGNLIDPFGFTWAISKEDHHTVNIRTKETSYIARQAQYDSGSRDETLDKYQRGA